MPAESSDALRKLAEKGLEMLKTAVLVELLERRRASSVELAHALFGTRTGATQQIVRFVLNTLEDDGRVVRFGRQWTLAKD